MAWFWRLSRIVAASHVAVCLVLLMFENRLIFPSPRADREDVDASVFDAEDVWFASADGIRLHGWFFAHPQPQGYLLYCHGNGDMVPWLGALAERLRREYALSVLVFDYRGYGLSEGHPEEQGVLRDGRAARDWLAERGGLRAEDVVLMGRSLGGAVAVELAADAGTRGLILQSTFSSMPDVAAIHYPWLPVRWLMRTQLNSKQRISAYHGPLLQSHGTADRIVPFEVGKSLFEAANQPKQFVAIPGMGHNDREPREYDGVLKRFLRDL